LEENALPTRHQSAWETYVIILVSVLRTILWVPLVILAIILVSWIAESLTHSEAGATLVHFLVIALFTGLILLLERGLATFQKRLEREIEERETRETKSG
tara:strand:+ start:744 stop:1043 length:300 start_codon:yes stop_codon:yes gene_type:complete